MAKKQDDTVGPEVDWTVDDQGRHVFVEDGLTYVLAKDGFAYAEADLGDLEVEMAEVEAEDAEDTADGAGTQTLGQAMAQAEAKSSGEAKKRRSKLLSGMRGRRDDDSPVAAIAKTDDDAAAAAGNGSAHSSMDDPVRVKGRAGRAEKTPVTDDTPVLLSLKDLKSGYGSLPVLHGVSVDVRRGETAVLLGLNGAGKTTTALNVCGALKVWSGTIEFDGQDITDWNTRKCVNAGVVMVPEGRRVFPDLTVAKNLQMGAWSQRNVSGWLEEGIDRVFEYFPRMRERSGQLAGTLSGGEQQMLAVGRGLMAKPKLLIIDEASMGLAPVIVQDVFDIISQINADGVTVLLIEQNVGALDVADLGLVMEQGRMVKQLRGERLKDRREVTEVLMG